MIKKVITVMLLCSTATVTWPGPFPYLATVTGIASDDHLNIRSAPNRLSAHIGSIMPNTQVEVLKTDISNKWAQIIWNKMNGWVALRYLRPIDQKHNAAGLPLNLRCNGTEPFWDLSLNTEQTIKINLTEQKQIVDSINWSSPSLNASTQTYAFRGQNYHAILRRTNCSNGMSDLIYGWMIDVILHNVYESHNTQLLSGCCESYCTKISIP